MHRCKRLGSIRVPGCKKSIHVVGYSDVRVFSKVVTQPGATGRVCHVSGLPRGWSPRVGFATWWVATCRVCHVSGCGRREDELATENLKFEQGHGWRGFERRLRTRARSGRWAPINRRGRYLICHRLRRRLFYRELPKITEDDKP